MGYRFTGLGVEDNEEDEEKSEEEEDTAMESHR